MAPLECRATATERIEIYPEESSYAIQSWALEGVTYACEEHGRETELAVMATGAVPDRLPVNEYEPPHRCGETVSYVGPVPA